MYLFSGYRLHKAPDHFAVTFFHLLTMPKHDQRGNCHEAASRKLNSYHLKESLGSAAAFLRKIVSLLVCYAWSSAIRNVRVYHRRKPANAISEFPLNKKSRPRGERALAGQRFGGEGRTPPGPEGWPNPEAEEGSGPTRGVIIRPPCEGRPSSHPGAALHIALRRQSLPRFVRTVLRVAALMRSAIGKSWVA